MADPSQTPMMIPSEPPSVTQEEQPMVIPGVVSPQLNSQMMLERAQHYDRALGPESPGPEVIYNRLINNQEPELRRELQIAQRTRLHNQRQEFLRQYIQNRPAGAVRPDELEIVSQLSSGELAEAQAGDPRLYIERRLADRTAQLVALARPASPTSDVTDRVIQTQQMLADYAQTRLQDLLQEYEQRNGATNALDILGSLLSPLQWYRRQNLIAPRVSSSFLPGNNAFEQAMWYHSRTNPVEATEALDRAIAQLVGRTNDPVTGQTAYEGNLLNAIQYVQNIVDNTTFNVNLENIMGMLDVSPGIGWIPYAAGGRLLYAGGRRILGRGATSPSPASASTPRTYATAQAQVAEAQIANRGRPDAAAAVQEASGDLAGAGAMTARDQLQARAAVTHPDGLGGSFTGYARSILNPEAVVSEAGTRLSNEAAQRMVTSLDSNADHMIGIVNRGLEIDRLGEPSPRLAGIRETAAEEAYRTAYYNQYPHVADRILDARIIMPNTYSHLPLELQKPAKAVFEFEKQIQRHGLKDQYDEFITNYLAMDRVSRQLRQFSRGNRAVPLDRPYKYVQEAMRRAGIDVDNLLIESRYLSGYMNGLSSADRRLFMQTWLADLKYTAGKLKLAANRNLVRPSGLEPAPNPQIVPVEKGLGNVNYIIIPFGTKNAELFPSVAQANLGAREMGLRHGSYKVYQQGTGYYVGVLKPLDETAPSVRRQLAFDTEMTPTNRPYFPHWAIQAIMGGSTKVTSGMAADLKAMVYGSSGMYKELANIVRQTMVTPFRFKKGELKDFKKFIEGQRITRDPDTNIPGVFSRNQFEFESDYNRVIGRFPTERESLAYWTYVQVSNLDKLLRDMSVYRDKVRSGLENHELRFLSNTTPFIQLEGKVLSQLPVDDARHERAGFLIWDRDPRAMQHVYINAKGGQRRLEDFISNGYRLIHITHFAERDLHNNPVTRGALERLAAEYKNDNLPGVDFVLTREVTSSPLPFQQTPNRPGGHHQYAFASLIRQPDIRNNRYYGDNTLRGFERPADAEFFLPRYEEARRIMNSVDASEGRIAESVLEDYLSKNLPESVSEFRRLFTSGPYNRNLPFFITRDGVNTWTAVKLADRFPGITNVRDSRLNLYNTSTLKFMMDRGETPLTIARSGTTENPSFHLAPAPLVDALPVMDRAIRHLVNNKYTADVQHKYAERFIAEFSDVLVPPRAELQRDPLHHLLNPEFRPGAPDSVVAAARNYSTVMRENLNIVTREMQWWQDTLQKMSDNLYRFGRKELAGQRLLQLPEIARPSLIKAIRDPVQAIRNATTYYYLTSPYQMIVQAFGALNIAAIGSYKLALQSIPAAIYGRIVRDFTGVPNMLETAAGKASLFGWTKAEFAEGYQAGVRSGYFNVGREHALHDDLAQAQTIRRGVIGTTLHLGMTPFRKGEETVRHMTWWAAYKTWRDANPGAILDDAATIQILQLADRMSGNMSIVGLSTMQRSAVGIPVTFWGYNMRIWEQMMGLDGYALTKWQKAKTMMNYAFVYSTLFGIPAAAGIAAYPASSFITGHVRRWLQEQRVSEPEDRSLLGAGAVGLEENVPLGNIALDIFMKGIIGWAGQGTNISERLSPGGNRFFADMLGDKTMFEILTGATGGAVRDVVLGSQPFVTAVMDAFRPHDARIGFQLGIEDYERVIANIGGRGASAVIRSYWALTLGELMSNQRMIMTGLTTPEAIIFTLTGLQPDRVDFAFDIIRDEDSLRRHQAFHSRFIVQEFRNMMRAAQEDRHEDTIRHGNNIQVHITLGRYRPEQIANLVGRVSRDQAELVENVFQRYARSGPRQMEFYQQYLRRLNKNF